MPSNPPAFPVQEYPGMTLRDYIAVHAMSLQFGLPGTTMYAAGLAKCCYEFADALLAERERTGDE